MAGFVCLLFLKSTRFPASVFLAGWIVYVLSTINASTAFYYVSAGSIEVAIGYTLNRRYRIVALLGYSLIIVNIYGLLLYKNGIGPITYDVAYAVISVTQFLLLLARVIPDGISRRYTKHFVVRAINFDSRGAYDRMYKNNKAKGENQ